MLLVSLLFPTLKPLKKELSNAIVKFTHCCLGLSERRAKRVDEDRRLLEQFLENSKLAHMSMPEQVRLKKELRPYQKQGIRWLDLLRRLGLHGALCDEMGLGKVADTAIFHLSSERRISRCGKRRRLCKRLLSSRLTPMKGEVATWKISLRSCCALQRLLATGNMKL